MTGMIDESGFNSRKEQKIYLFYTASSLVPRPPSLLYNGHQDSVFGIKQLGHEADTHLHLVPKLRSREFYLHPPIRLHSVVLNYALI
jgi:hypothetical protein